MVLPLSSLTKQIGEQLSLWNDTFWISKFEITEMEELSVLTKIILGGWVILGLTL